MYNYSLVNIVCVLLLIEKRFLSQIYERAVMLQEESTSKIGVEYRRTLKFYILSCFSYHLARATTTNLAFRKYLHTCF